MLTLGRMRFLVGVACEMCGARFHLDVEAGRLHRADSIARIGVWRRGDHRSWGDVHARLQQWVHDIGGCNSVLQRGIVDRRVYMHPK